MGGIFGKKEAKEKKYAEDEGFDEPNEKDFIKVEEEPFIMLKFFTIDEDMKIKEIVGEIKNGNVILFIDVSAIMDDPGTLRIFVNKIRRVSDDYSVVMKLYGGNWLLVLPQNVTFHVGDE